MAICILLKDTQRYGATVNYVEYTEQFLLEQLAELHYQLRLEYDHSTMAWYAYYAGRANYSLFDKAEHWNTSGDTPQMALVRLLYATLTEPKTTK
jgi:hypothetical protein